jgi:hypothetical protein
MSEKRIAWPGRRCLSESCQQSNSFFGQICLEKLIKLDENRVKLLNFHKKAELWTVKIRDAIAQTVFSFIGNRSISSGFIVFAEMFRQFRRKLA